MLQDQQSLIALPRRKEAARWGQKGMITLSLWGNGDASLQESYIHVDVSENSGTPKSSILTGFSTINHPFWGVSPYFWKHPCMTPVIYTVTQQAVIGGGLSTLSTQDLSARH